MLERLLPRRFDNDYRGGRPALWLFAALVLVKIGMSLNTVFMGRYVAANADGIPLDTFTPAAAQTALAFFAIWGVAHLMICLLCVLALVRYRAMVPLMFAFLLLEHLTRKLVLQLIPPARIGTPPGFYFNLALVGLMIIGLALSLRGRGDLPARA